MEQGDEWLETTTNPLNKGAGLSCDTKKYPENE